MSAVEPPTWDQARGVVLHRDGYICQLCMSAPATEVDHIWPRSEGGPDLLRNLQAACASCNKAKGASVGIATEEQLGWARDFWLARVREEQAKLDTYDESLDLLRLHMEGTSRTVAEAARLIAEAA